MIQEGNFQGVNYALYTPQTPSKNLVVFFHGSGEGGTKDGSQLSRVYKHGWMAQAKAGKNFPFMMLAPQGIKEVGYVISDFSLVRKVLPALIKTLEPAVKLATGLSQGGQEVLGYYTNSAFGKAGAYWYPFDDLEFDGYLVMCGSAPATPQWGVNDKPLLMIHGDSDDAVNISQARKVIIETAKLVTPLTNKPVLMEIPGGEHSTAWTRGYDTSDDPYGKAAVAFTTNIFKETVPAPIEIYPKNVISSRMVNATGIEFIADDGTRYYMGGLTKQE